MRLGCTLDDGRGARARYGADRRAELRARAVELIREGAPVVEAARAIDVRPTTLSRWLLDSPEYHAMRESQRVEHHLTTSTPAREPGDEWRERQAQYDRAERERRLLLARSRGAR